MATRPQVETGIAGIKDNGNNTAKKVRDVLTSLLDYTENTDTNVQLPLFDFWDKSPLEDTRGGALWYSFRGIENTYVNFTFKLLIRESNVTSFRFKLDNTIIKTLTPFFQQFEKSIMSFAVPVMDVDKKTFRLWTLYFRFREDILMMTLLKNPFSTDDRIQKGDEVFTSIQFHCPPFNFD